MSKGTWKKPKCNCGSCKNCYDRARQDKIRKGEWKTTRQLKDKSPEVVQARKMRIADWREDVKARKEQAQADKALRAQYKARNEPLRKKRSEAFKHNVAFYGAEKAKKIAVCITKKQKGTYHVTDRAKAATTYAGILGYVNFSDPEE